MRVFRKKSSDDRSIFWKCTNGRRALIPYVIRYEPYLIDEEWFLVLFLSSNNHSNVVKSMDEDREDDGNDQLHCNRL